MGASLSNASSSSTITTPPQTKHDVFLCFTGEHGTGGSFVSHLCDALSRKHIETFVDGPGDEVSPSSLSAIEACKICLVVFSTDYAHSKGCLRELAEIIKLKKVKEIVVIPVFYQIDPADVRKQIGVFKNAFDKYQKVYREELQMWREALTEASNVAGWDSSVTRPESRLVDEIVKDVLKKLNDKSILTDFRGLVGMDSRVEEVISLLSMETFDFRFVGIWGMGGIGKTTFAGAVFDQISWQFDGCCFVSHVREESQNCGGLVHLRDKLLCQLLGEKLNLGTPHIPPLIKRRLQKIRVLIVLDDVSNWEQIEILAGGVDRLGSGSRVVITTRDKQLLKKFVAPNNIYEVKALDNHEALQLFCNCAFKKDPIPEDLMAYARRATDYAKGNPLALKVLGSSLYQKSEQDWESALHKLHKIPKPEIHNILRIGYDALDREEKDIVLDIGCFFKGEYRDYAIELLKSCYLSVQAALSVLVDKSLIVMSGSEIFMHDLVQEMCWEIVRQEAISKPGERSRLHSHEDVCRVLRRNIGTESVKGILLDMSNIRSFDLDSQAFENMYNLRYLKLYDWTRSFGDPTSISKIHLSNGVTSLPHGLRYLSWHGYPSKVLPLMSNVENLVELNLFDSKVEQLWEGKKGAPKLKRLILGHSQQLTRIPDLSSSPELEVIDLVDCRSLVDISSSVQNLNNLMYLRLSGCESLRSFSNGVHFESLRNLDISSCRNLMKFPQVSGNIQLLSLKGSAIEEVPSSIETLTKLYHLQLSDCSNLTHISTNICKLKSLHFLKLKNCSKLEYFPEILETMKRLKTLDLSGTAIRRLPYSIAKLPGLLELLLRDCKNLETLPSSIRKLATLKTFDLSSCTNLNKLPVKVRDLSAGGKAETSQLSSSRCLRFLLDCFAAQPSSGSSFSLKYLYLSNCNLTEIPEDISCLSSLVSLDLCRNDFESLPTSIKELKKLERLLLNDCNELRCVPMLPLNLLLFEAMNCKQLHSLPETPEFVEFITSKRTSETDSGFFYINIMLTNSPKLDVEAFGNVFQESLQIIQLMEMAGTKNQDGLGINICYPGSTMPECFSDQSFGSSINVQLSPLNRSDRIFLGYALCAVITFKGYCYPGDRFSGVPYHCCFRTDHGDQIAFKGTLVVRAVSQYGDESQNEECIFVDSDHVLIGYYDQSKHRLRTDKFTSCTIGFKAPDDSTSNSSVTSSSNTEDVSAASNESRSWNLKCYGAFPIYAPE